MRGAGGDFVHAAAAVGFGKAAVHGAPDDGRKEPRRGKQPMRRTGRQFIGRGRSRAVPAAMESRAALSGSAGAVLDPIVAIRRGSCWRRMNRRSWISVTGISETRQEAMALVEKYRDPRMGDRVFEMAWTHSQVVLGLLNASEADAQIFGRLAGCDRASQPPATGRCRHPARNRRGQSGLWGYGISGDLPIVLLRISDQERMDLVRQMVQAHAYWRMKGLAVDLVIWNEDHSGYRQAVQDRIMGILAAGPERTTDRPAGRGFCAARPSR